MENNRNWAGNYTYGAIGLLVPESMSQLQEMVSRSGRMKTLGTRHSFNGIADSSGTHVSLQKMNRVLEIDFNEGKVTVEGGIRYGELCGYLHANGLALHNLASLPHISVAGACATATHGSGDRNGNLATAVSAMTLVKADGEAVRLTRGQPEFEGAVVGLGALGVVANLTLEVVPAFQISQRVYENLPLANLEQHLDDIFSSAYSVSLFMDWKRPVFNQVWLKHRTDEAAGYDEPEFFGATLATAKLHPVPGLSAENCSEQLGVSGPWFERLPHFRMNFMPSAGEELQSEYFVPRSHAYEALLAIDSLRDYVSPLLYISEVRSIASDELWMSPCCRQPSIAIHFTWKADWEAVRRVLPMIEEKLEPFNAKPHWGKLFAMPSDRLCPLYEKLPDFRRLLHQYDPQGKFRNDFLIEYM
ncbi:FAD-binding protein [Paenibacillus montanisoli]|uniref:FAD-binding protein n=1 Tax=Paenibacillus montanisoli TaxID=2081970 RepID=A0A328U3N4_9BACL|nr:FAD-binding protein [Paenibacillus montanisoli]RAP77220.1 FAD-binding protein [Paenibacillus montanisoli]